MNSESSNTHEQKTNVGKKLNLLLCCAGQATKERIKCLLSNLKDLSNIINEFHIRVIGNNESCSLFKDNSNLIEMIYTDDDEWAQWKQIGDPVLHIDLTKWADILLVAPMDVETMGKVAIGICDNLLTCTLRAWNLKKPVIFCPAISKTVREQSITQKHLSTLRSWGYKEISPAIYPDFTATTCEYPMVEPTEINTIVISLIEEKS
ncbi:hypothetical protein O3M35_010723 [Rhynocoris fuscipes]|uniref:Flavoprotein domain-containing protein n=1 Tax=Rhynocoris fuscipes TaxID=488301 RepID=A0AAW1D2C9_9HEMI